MTFVFFASVVLSQLVAASWRAPTRCPYCAAGTCCWIKWASYERFGDGANRVRVPRYLCKITRRTFSILPDSLLPYHNPSTAKILGWLMEMFVEGTGTASVARMAGVGRSTVRLIRAQFENAVRILRLPGHEGALAPATFLNQLASLSPDGIAELFATWKELEPKHSIVGIYPR